MKLTLIMILSGSFLLSAQPVAGEILGRIYLDPISNRYVFEKADVQHGYILATQEVIQSRLDALNGGK